jgi:hypothetical protein
MLKSAGIGAFDRTLLPFIAIQQPSEFHSHGDNIIRHSHHRQRLDQSQRSQWPGKMTVCLWRVAHLMLDTGQRGGTL